MWLLKPGLPELAVPNGSYLKPRQFSIDDSVFIVAARYIFCERTVYFIPEN